MNGLTEVQPRQQTKIDAAGQELVCIRIVLQIGSDAFKDNMAISTATQ
jgi:hypothetical protein